MLPINPIPGEQHRSEGNVDQIRDILFGGQMREYDHRFAQLERQTAGESERLRLEIEERFRNLAEQSSAALRQLNEQLQAERETRTAEAQASRELRAAFENLTREAKEASERSEIRLREQETKLGEQENKLREQENKLGEQEGRLREQADRLREHAAQHQAAHEAARKEHEALAARIDEQMRQLTASSAERDTMSDLFTEMAGRLRRQPQPPSA